MDCAFVSSDYPVILSIENHLCRAQQYKMAKYFDEVFGEYLGRAPLPEWPVSLSRCMPDYY
jgi:Phosphatidylinositol-specific phospholipase C, X domain